MKFNELQTTPTKKLTRVGRGISAGKGKTAGRGTKGQRSRTGSSRKPGFEGGQNPLMQRLPKLPGFRSYKIADEAVYTGQLDAIAKKKITTVELAEAGLISNAYVKVKLIVKGDVRKAIAVELQGASSKAVDLLEAAGGSFTKVARVARPQTSEKKIAKTSDKASK